MIDGLPLEEWIRAELERTLAERLAAAPWWCRMCGAAGNLDAGPERFGDAWWPPEDHVCTPSPMPPLRGIMDITDAG